MTRKTRISRKSLAAMGLMAAIAANGTVVAASDDLSYPLVDTGQTSFYNADGESIAAPAEGEAFYGQDATYVGNQPSYTDNGDGTVSDDVTGLIWEQDPSDETYSFDDAQTYCETLELGGSDDWRTPSLKELFSISDFGSGWPYIDLDYFELTDAGMDKSQQFWSDNHYEVGTTHDGASSAFGVNHATGHIKAYPDGNDGNQRAGKYVRCVSGNEDYGVNDYVDNSDGTIIDEATGLMWSVADSGEGMDWESALAYAQEMNDEMYLGYGDWRVPDVKELQSIVDYSGVYPAIDTELFDVTDEDSYFWTSTSAYFSPQDEGRYYAWYVAAGYAVGPDGEDTHGAGAVRFDTKEEGGPAGEDPERIFNYVRLVRGGDVTIDTETTVEESEANAARDESLELVEESGPGGAPEGADADGEGQPVGGPDGGQRPDMGAAADALGVSEQALMDALGDPPPDFEATAKSLGLTVEALQEALGGDQAGPPPADQ